MKRYLVALLFVPAMAQAEFMTGNKLLSDMKSQSVIDQAIALGYVQGVFDSHQQATHCAPRVGDITAGQVRDLALQYLEQNPALRHKNADFILGELFKRVWPCPHKGTGV